MCRCDLTVRVLEHVRHCALQDADAAAAAFPARVKSSGVFTQQIAASSCFHADQSNLLVCYKGMKQADRI